MANKSHQFRQASPIHLSLSPLCLAVRGRSLILESCQGSLLVPLAHTDNHATKLFSSSSSSAHLFLPACSSTHPRPDTRTPEASTYQFRFGALQKFFHVSSRDWDQGSRWRAPRGMRAAGRSKNLQKVIACWGSGTSRSLGGLVGTEPFWLPLDCWPSPRPAAAPAPTLS